MKRGRKQNEWIEARAKIIKRAIEEGKIVVNESGNIMGRCADCAKYRPLSPDHRISRARGGTNYYANIDWLCTICHQLKHEGKSMAKKNKSKKPEWVKDHACINCKVQTRHFICHSCNRVSVKIPTR